MKQSENNISYLIVKFIKEEINDKELAKLELWIDRTPANKLLFESLLKESNFEKRILNSPDIDLDNAYSQLKQRINIPNEQNIKFWNWKRISAYAASFIIPLTIGILFFLRVHGDKQQNIASIETGSQKTELFFSTGEKFELDQTTTDTIYKDNTKLVANNGVVSYSNAANIKSEINKIVVPRGSEYQMILADGTRVWLNSESELKFPTIFTESTRSVELKGEAYFDVAKNKEVPFIVKTSGQLIKVLGTEFNVRNYSDEKNITVTLVEGSVELISTGKHFDSFQLRPGEQAKLNFEDMTIKKNIVDVNYFISWKDGSYIYKSQPLEVVMKELSRWYNIEVIYKDEEVKSRLVTGRIKRTKNFNSFIELIERIEVGQFKIDGHTIIVSK